MKRVPWAISNFKKIRHVFRTNYGSVANIHPVLLVRQPSKQKLWQIPIGYNQIKQNSTKYEVIPTCVMCDEGDETREHFILTCKALSQKKGPIPSQTYQYLNTNTGKFRYKHRKALRANCGLFKHKDLTRTLLKITTYSPKLSQSEGTFYIPYIANGLQCSVIFHNLWIIKKKKGAFKNKMFFSSSFTLLIYLKCPLSLTLCIFMYIEIPTLRTIYYYFYMFYVSFINHGNP